MDFDSLYSMYMESWVWIGSVQDYFNNNWIKPHPWQVWFGYLCFMAFCFAVERNLEVAIFKKKNAERIKEIREACNHRNKTDCECVHYIKRNHENKTIPDIDSGDRMGAFIAISTIPGGFVPFLALYLGPYIGYGLLHIGALAAFAYFVTDILPPLTERILKVFKAVVTS